MPGLVSVAVGDTVGTKQQTAGADLLAEARRSGVKTNKCTHTILENERVGRREARGANPAIRPLWWGVAFYRCSWLGLHSSLLLFCCRMQGSCLHTYKTTFHQRHESAPKLTARFPGLGGVRVMAVLRVWARCSNSPDVPIQSIQTASLVCFSEGKDVCTAKSSWRTFDVKRPAVTFYDPMLFST